MGTKYTTQGITGYNSGPPPDDGTTGDDNKVKWENHTEKIGDPIVAQVEAIDDKIVAMVDVAPIATAADYTTDEDDDGRVRECTSSPDITLGAAATMGSGYSVTIKTVSGTTTVSPGGADTIDGTTDSRILGTGISSKYTVNEGADGYLIAGGSASALTHSGTNFTGRTQTLGEATNIPASANQVIVSLDRVSISATGNISIELGDSSYAYDSADVLRTKISSSAATSITEITTGEVDVAGNIINAAIVSGTIVFTRIYSNENWSVSGNVILNDTLKYEMFTSSGFIDVTGTTDRIRITAGQTFDAGTASVYWI